MVLNALTVRRKVLIVRQYKGLRSTAELQGYYLPTAEAIPAKCYNGRIAYRYKDLRVGLTTLRKQPLANFP